MSEGGDVVFISTLQSYIQGILRHIPGIHWAVIVLLSLASTGFMLMRKKCAVYGAIALGISVFVGLFLLDTAVVIRYLGTMKHMSGYDLQFDFSRLFRDSGLGPSEMISNIVAFIPFSLFLSEFLASAKRFSAGRRLGFATLAGCGLSLCIECLQLVLRVGFFELTDLVMNTLGAFVGAGVAVVIRSLLAKQKKKSVTINPN